MKGRKLEYYLDEYINTYCLLEKGQTETGVYKKHNSLKLLLKFLDGQELSIVTINEYRKFLLTEGWTKPSKPSSVHYGFRNIKAFVNWMNKKHQGELNFKGPDIELPSLKRINHDIVPIETAEKIILEGTKVGIYDRSKIHKRSKADSRIAMTLSLYTGMRAVELLRLQGEDLDFDNMTFTIRSKGGHLDTAPLPPVDWLIEELQKRASNEKVFVCSRDAMNGHLKRGMKALKIDKKITLHSLRRIFATDLANRGAQTHDIAQAMRHSNIQITWANYIRLNPEHQRDTLMKYHGLTRKNRTLEQKVKDMLQLIEKSGIVKSYSVDGDDIVLKVGLK